MARTLKKEIQMRMRLAQEAAKIMIDSGIRDFAMAKRKAAEHLNAHDTRQLPTNLEIEQAMVEYQRLFRANEQPLTLQRLREVTYRAMQFFQDFNPRLVGPVLTGTADTNTPVTLHVFSDHVEAVNLLLLDKHIPFESRDKRYKIANDTYEQYPCFEFFAEQTKVEVVVFPASKHYARPLSPIDGKPMQRADMAALEVLLHQAL